jgi:molybdopterin-guanine dinucleotide biosynthesis protein A
MVAEEEAISVQEGSVSGGGDTPLTGLIVAGGKSTRFGSDKASAPLMGRPLLQWVGDALQEACSALVVVRARGQTLPDVTFKVPVTVVDDRHDALGPLAGLVAGFGGIASGVCMATSCDAPLVRPELVRFLASLAPGHDVVCPYVDGFLQPLLAVYRPATCLPVLERALDRGVLKITAAYGGLRLRIVQEEEVRVHDPGLVSFRNANRPEALHEIEELLKRGPG